MLYPTGIPNRKLVTFFPQLHIKLESVSMPMKTLNLYILILLHIPLITNMCVDYLYV